MEEQPDDVVEGIGLYGQSVALWEVGLQGGDTLEQAVDIFLCAAEDDGIVAARTVRDEFLQHIFPTWLKQCPDVVETVQAVFHDGQVHVEDFVVAGLIAEHFLELFVGIGSGRVVELAAVGTFVLALDLCKVLQQGDVTAEIVVGR